MKLTLIFIVAAMLNVSAKGVSQNITFNGKDVPLQEVVAAIKKQTGFAIFYNAELLDKAKPVTLNVTNVTLKDFLQEAFKDQPLDFSIKNTTIVISSKAVVATAFPNQPYTDIKGRVTNENGEPLVGANVMVKGTNQGSTTDNNGYYKIENIGAGTYTLEVSYIGYGTKTTSITITENNAIGMDFKLTPSLVNLDQLTVTSTLSARKIRSYPATIAELKGKDLENRNLNNIANVLEMIPGILIPPGSEGINNGSTRFPQLTIRGTFGLVKYIVDGVEIIANNFLQTLDPNNIEKIEVLKGPMASTLYGSGAGGGIIAITTKKGRSGKTSINFKTMLTDRSNDYADYKGYQQDYSLNVSGGNEQFNYLIGTGYNLYPTTKLSDFNNGIDDKTWSYTAKIGGKINTVKADVSLRYGRKNSGSSSTTLSFNKFLESLGLSTYPPFPIQDYRDLQRSFATVFHLTHTLKDNWYHDLTVGYDIENSGSSTYSDVYSSGSFSNSEYLKSKMNIRYFMYYDHSWSKALKTSITAGFEYNDYETHNMYLNSTTTLANFFTIYTPAVSGSASYNKSPYSSTGYFAEAVTGLNNRLFLTTGIRFDVNSAYGENIKSYAQPRVGLSYVIESGLLKMKPRVVWGVSSDAPDPTYKIAYIEMNSYGTFVYPGNPGLKPTRSEGYEFGGDIFYGNNYSLNITYYNQRLKDMISYSSITDYSTNPPTTTTYYYNIAKSVNHGLEVSAKAALSPFTVDLSYTTSINKWGEQTPSIALHPGAPLLNIPKRSGYVRLMYSISSFLSWTKKGGSISLDWRYNGSAYCFNDVGYGLATVAWDNAPDPKPAYPDYNNYLVWMKSYSYFNLRADYSVANSVGLYVDVQNLLDKQGSTNGQLLNQFPGRRINLGFNINF